MVLPQERNQECKVRMQSVDTFALLHPCTLTRYDRLMCRPHGALSLKGEPMNNETSKTSTPAAASPLTAKPDLVKNIGGTTFDIHIHFSETSRETFTDKVVRLFRTTAVMKPLKSKILFSCSLLTKPERHHPGGVRQNASARHTQAGQGRQAHEG